MCRLAAGCAAGDAPAENTFQSFDEIRCAERSAGLLRRPDRRERQIASLRRNERHKIRHAVEHRPG
ncbi:MAG: hypothetical protein CVT73_17565 [Alphaproteobacteria bacterium HGW-Alphaproteobacteria-12]|nr:MAG: hypothetical protein CVT73_17565 [Alphaproteobacteria bacterium HGW-Alphaproteobacteria-12]